VHWRVKGWNTGVRTLARRMFIFCKVPYPVGEESYIQAAKQLNLTAKSIYVQIKNGLTKLKLYLSYIHGTLFQ
jgi:hypothetical protein